MNIIEIHETKVSCIAETGPSYYTALNASGKGKLVARVAGPEIEIHKWAMGDESADMCWLSADAKARGGEHAYALRDILAFARNGKHGLSLA
jgi:hypothetical protein